MKKILLSLLVITFLSTSLIAQVPREMVLVEIATGTWCGYCPGAAMGAHELMLNGDPVAVIENHNGDVFANDYSNARNTYYSIPGYPHAKFDGGWGSVSGGSSSTSMYSSYLPKVTARMAIPAEFSLEIYGQNSGNNYDITLRVNKESTYSGTNLKVRFALTETDIPYNWQNQTTIDYANRLMVPDADGTPVTFSGLNSVDVNLSFVFDNSWVDSNCELIAWIQDDDDKYVLHTQSVMLLALQPDAAVANFSANTTTVCEGETVQYTDLSGGIITSWDWTFEGGTPATSTDQNPIVTYNTEGTYDVTLDVSDGPTFSTLVNDDMIQTRVIPAQPDTPVGETEVCNDGIYTYATQPVTYTDTYFWEVLPSDAGTITGSGTEVTFEADSDWTGTYTITVRADNSCGDGTMSGTLNCNMHFMPTAFMLSGGGGICPGSPGSEVILFDSEANVVYDLYLDDVFMNITMPGTGEEISFGLQTVEGTYSVMGASTICEIPMIGTHWIYYKEYPAQASTPSGLTEVCNTSTSDYSISLVAHADIINWVLTPAEAGTITGGDLDVSIEWSFDFTGMATLTAQGSNECGDGPISDALSITVSQTPMPVITGLTLICNDDQADYSTEEVTGSTYAWDIVGGEVVAGVGTSIVTVLWGDPGNGSVFVTEISAANCEGYSDYFDVVIDDCIGIDEEIVNQDVLLYPNPASRNVEIVFNEKIGANYSVIVYNSIGQIVAETKGIASGENTNINIDVSNYFSGIYIINLTTESGLNIRRTFEKTK